MSSAEEEATAHQNGSEAPGAAGARAAIERSGVAFSVTRHGPAGSLEESAAARGIAPRDIVKTLVVRRAEHDFIFVLVPGDREISWPKLRALLGVKRMSMPDAETAREATGYERGTITPFGATHVWPVVADESVAGRSISMGAGAHGIGFTADGSDLIRVLDATVGDVTDLRSPRPRA